MNEHNDGYNNGDLSDMINGYHTVIPATIPGIGGGHQLNHHSLAVATFVNGLTLSNEIVAEVNYLLGGKYNSTQLKAIYTMVAQHMDSIRNGHRSLDEIVEWAEEKVIGRSDAYIFENFGGHEHSSNPPVQTLDNHVSPGSLEAAFAGLQVNEHASLIPTLIPTFIGGLVLDDETVMEIRAMLPSQESFSANRLTAIYTLVALHKEPIMLGTERLDMTVFFAHNYISQYPEDRLQEAVYGYYDCLQNNMNPPPVETLIQDLYLDRKVAYEIKESLEASGLSDIALQFIYTKVASCCSHENPKAISLRAYSEIQGYTDEQILEKQNGPYLQKGSVPTGLGTASAELGIDGQQNMLSFNRYSS